MSTDAAMWDDTPRDDFEALADLASTIAEQRGDAARDDAEGVGRPPARPLCVADGTETLSDLAAMEAEERAEVVGGRPRVTLTDAAAGRLLLAIFRTEGNAR